MDDPRTTRASLLHALRESPGDEAAWAEFVRVYAPAVLGWCRARGLQETDAEDAAQTVLVRFWRQAVRFDYDPSRKFRHYLKRIVTTVLADWHTAAPSERRQSDHDGFAAALATAPARDELVTRMEEAFDGELMRLAMEQVASRVQPHTWEAFRLLALEHLTGREVATRLGMEVNTAYVARSKVLRLIREEVAHLRSEQAGQAEQAIDD